MTKHWWDGVEADWQRYQDEHPNDDRDLLEVAESGDWERWYDSKRRVSDGHD